MSTVFSKLDIPSKHLSILESTVGELIHATLDPTTVESTLPSNYKLIKLCVPCKYEQFADRIQNFKIRPDDVWLVGYFKTGTTWVHNIIWQLKNNLNFSAPTIGYSHNLFEQPIYHSAIYNKQFDNFDKMPSPRIFKTHLPVYLLPKELWIIRPKIIYTTRNPKDIAVSSFHFGKAIYNAFLTKEDIFNACLNELGLMTPLHAHVLSFWELRNLEHAFFSRYEDLLADQFNGVKEISKFLDCSLSDKEITDLVDHVEFRKMRDRIPMVTLDGKKLETSNYRFCRKGKAGNYRNEMSEEFIKRFDEWSADQLRNSDFKFADV